MGTGNLPARYNRLKKIISSMKSVLVAYSGGVDSTFLLKAAVDVLGHDTVAALTAESVTFPAGEVVSAKKLVKKLGIRHIIIKTHELQNPRFADNRTDRCYWCKKELFSRSGTVARKEGLAYVLDGTNFDDTKDMRPGMKAARECNVRSPLKEARLTKDDIRRLSRKLGLPTWNRPAFACLASRFPYGEKITGRKLTRVAEGEQFLKTIGLEQLRLRQHGTIARIEVPSAEIEKLVPPRVRNKVVRKLKELGYTYVTIDLEGYRSGSMNEVL